MWKTRALTSGELDHVRRRDIVQRRLGAQRVAGWNDLQILHARGALVGQDQGAVAGTGKAVVERGADGLAGRVGAEAIAADECRLEICGDFGPHRWTLGGLSCCDESGDG